MTYTLTKLSFLFHIFLLMDLIEMNIRESSSLPCSVILKNMDKISGPYLVFTDTTTSLVSEFVIDS